MSADSIAAVELEPPSEARACVIWLHGLGADGNDFVPVVPMLGLAEDAAVRFVFPHAPSIPVTVNAGMVMPAWYDITSLSLGRQIDEKGLAASVETVRALIARENQRGIPCERIVIAGFSQGGAVAFHAALSHPERLAGCLALSTYLPADAALESELAAPNRDLPIFQGHGVLDPMVNVALGEAARDRLMGWGYEVEWHTYPMQHEVSIEEIRDAGGWLAERV